MTPFVDRIFSWKDIWATGDVDDSKIIKDLTSSIKPGRIAPSHRSIKHQKNIKTDLGKREMYIM